MSCTTFDDCIQDKYFPSIASLVLFVLALIFLALVLWLITRMRKLRRELELIRNDLMYSTPGPAPKDNKLRAKNEYTGNVKVEIPETKRQSALRQESDEIVTYVPSPQSSPRIKGKSRAELVSGATSDQSPAEEVCIEMEYMYENQQSIQLDMDSRETSTDPVDTDVDLHELPWQLSRDEHGFGNDGFDGDVITEPIYQNRGELADSNNPQLEFITDSDYREAGNTVF